MRLDSRSHDRLCFVRTSEWRALGGVGIFFGLVLGVLPLYEGLERGAGPLVAMGVVFGTLVPLGIWMLSRRQEYCFDGSSGVLELVRRSILGKKRERIPFSSIRELRLQPQQIFTGQSGGGWTTWWVLVDVPERAPIAVTDEGSSGEHGETLQLARELSRLTQVELGGALEPPEAPATDPA